MHKAKRRPPRPGMCSGPGQRLAHTAAEAPEIERSRNKTQYADERQYQPVDPNRALKCRFAHHEANTQ